MSVHPLLTLGKIVREKLTGLLRCQEGRIVRQLKWRNGNLTVAASNAKTETPGGYLRKQNVLSEEQLAQFLVQTPQSQKPPWEVVASLTKLSKSQLEEHRKRLSMQIVSASIAHAESTEFRPSSLEGSAEGALAGVSVLISCCASLSDALVGQIFPAYQDDSLIRITKGADQESEQHPLSSEERGVLKVLQANDKVAEVFSASFLPREQIRSLLLAYTLMGWVELVDAHEAASRAFEASLTQVQKNLRAEIREVTSAFLHTNYYQWIGVPSNASAEEIEMKATSRMEGFATPTVDLVFNEKEKNLPMLLLERLAEAKRVLLHPAQRAEYDVFLAAGGSGSFLSESVSVREEDVLRKAKELGTSNQVDQEVNLLAEGITRMPDSVAMGCAFVRAVLRLGETNRASWSDRVRSELRRLLEKNPDNSSLYEALGDWLEGSGQREQAIAAYRKALAFDALSSRAKKGLRRLDAKGSAKTILAILEKNLPQLNHYELLGVDPHADHRTIQAGYRECTRHFHPDRFFQSDDAGLKQVAKSVYKRMVEAYVTLKSPQRRKAYDTMLAREKVPS